MNKPKKITPKKEKKKKTPAIRFTVAPVEHCVTQQQQSFIVLLIQKFKTLEARGGGGEWGILGIFGWECGAGTLEPLFYTRASSAEFCYPLLE